MTTRKSPSLRALALAIACLTAACTAPLSPQDSRALRTQAAGGDSIRVKSLAVTPEGMTLDIEASEAILALTNPTSTPLSVRAHFDGTAPASQRQVASLSKETHAECGFKPYRKLKLPARPALRTLEEPQAPRELKDAMPFVLATLDQTGTLPVPQATRLYDGKHCVIYLDDRDAEWLSPEEAEELGRKFDNETYPTLTATFGAELPHPGDDFNYGQDRVIVLVTRELAGSLPNAAGMVDTLDFLHPALTAQYGVHSNYAKMIYLLPSASNLPAATMAHEFVHVLFAQHRLKTYGEHHGNGGTFGQDPSYYLDDQTLFSELPMNEGLAELGKFIAGYSPEATPVYADRIAKFLGNPQLYAFHQLHGPGGSNYGGMSLVNSFLYGRDAAFPRKFLTAEATASEAISEALGQDFTAFYRDFTLALALDGMSAQVPSRYQIPMVDLHATYQKETSLVPLRGANDSNAPLVLTAPRPYGVRFTRVRFPSGKGKLTISGSPELKASVILLDPSRPQGFVED